MATVEEMIAYIHARSDALRDKLVEIQVLTRAVLDEPNYPFPWKTCNVDLAAAQVDYLVLLDEAKAIMDAFPRTPDDVPE